MGLDQLWYKKRGKKQALEIETAFKKEEDLIKHGGKNGGKNVCQASSELCMSNPTEGCELIKRTFFFEIMFQNRKKASDEEKANINAPKFRNISLLKQVYFVSSSVSGKKNYDVTVCNFPTCTCEDFGKNYLKVFCKHILFIMLNILNNGEFFKSYPNCFIPDRSFSIPKEHPEF